MANNFSIIKPVGVLPIPIPLLPFEITMQLSLFFGFVLFALLLGFLLEKQIKKQWEPYRALNLILPIIAATLLFLRFGIGMQSIKGLTLFMLLLYASNSDLKTREVNDNISIMITITALIGIGISNIPMMLLGAICVTIPQLLMATLKPNSYGGADIKIMAACSFLLGLERGLVAIIVGLLLAVIVTITIRKIQKKDLKDTFPIVPYLSIGSFLAFLI
jgi:leader peptidase (prepilin peptidase)/N-methyltransferase